MERPVGGAGRLAGRALKCAPRDRWIMWRRQEMFRRLHLLANNTRFVVLGKRGVFANLAS